MGLLTFLSYYIISALTYQLLIIAVAVSVRYVRYRLALKKQASLFKQGLVIVKEQQNTGEDDTWH